MRTEKCLTCINYKPQPEDQRTGREWMNSTGWCEAPSLYVKRRRINEDNWCDQYCEKDTPDEPNQTIGEALETAHELEHEDVEADSFAVETSKSFEHWRLTIREKLADIRTLLDELDTLINTPYEDLE